MEWLVDVQVASRGCGSPICLHTSRLGTAVPTIAATAVALSPSIAVAIASPLHLPLPLPLRRRCVVHCLRQKCLAAGGHYNGVVCSLPCRHPPTMQEEKGGVPPQYGYAPEVLAPMLLLYLNLSHNGVAVPTPPPTSSLALSNITITVASA